MQKEELRQIEIKSLNQLHQWLIRNHSQNESVWLVTYKKVRAEYYIEYSKIVDELLCFGWIDSLPRKLDAGRKMLRISPRKPKSAWSKINRDKVAKLLAEGRIERSGLVAIEKAKQNGSWSLLKSTDSNQIPEDLKKAFVQFPSSKKFFEAYPSSSRRAILEWIAQAKTSSTRQKRVLETAKMASENRRANHYKQPQKRK